MTSNTKTELRLAAMIFLEFAVWGSYLISLGNYLGRIGFGERVGWFYAAQGIIALFMPTLIGIVADRYTGARRMLSLCHVLFACFMGAAGIYGLTVERPDFGVLFGLYVMAVAFFMPTIGLVNALSFKTLRSRGIDTVARFPRIRVMGTVGFICAMLFVNFTEFQTDARQLVTSAVTALVLAVYALTLPRCDAPREKASEVISRSWLGAFDMLRDSRMAVFFGLCILGGVALQITNSYGNMYISSFARIAAFADTWGAANANAVIAVSQASEALCLLLIPVAMRRFGIRTVIASAMLAWSLRFTLLGLGDTGSGLWLLLLSGVVYGVAFDFFSIAGGIYVDRCTTPDRRSSAQGLFMAMSTGIGGSAGILIAQQVVNRLVFSQPPGLARLYGWTEFWMLAAAYALAVGLLFVIFFRGRRRP